MIPHFPLDNLTSSLSVGPESQREQPDTGEEQTWEQNTDTGEKK